MKARKLLDVIITAERLKGTIRYHPQTDLNLLRSISGWLFLWLTLCGMNFPKPIWIR